LQDVESCVLRKVMVFTLRRILFGDQIEVDKGVGRVALGGPKRTAYRILVGKSVRKRLY
jgi:hypothetical protein